MESNNTSRSFSDKWHKNAQLAFKTTSDPQSEVFNWIVGRNGFKDEQGLVNYLSDKKRILDGGCGNGRVTALLRKYSNPETTEIVGIDLTAADVAQENLSDEKNVHFYSKNLLDNLEDLGKFDFIYCQEVLHHTGNALKGFENLVQILEPGGEIAIYVYKQKAPVREFVDDYIRDRIADLSYEEAIKHCDQLTELGKVLSELKLNIKVPAVDLLQIEAGEYDIQRFLYHFFAKLFWNDAYTFNENSVINYDWYHPIDCTRHTIEEVRDWFNQSGLVINHECVDHYGITVKGKKTDEK
ncbi:class I SAM-dependent methyltransferase [Taibaiella lutea]|uniref:Class I SAM-dependent methyltransferase n=1 Tax=Taibaiella lutea TaxID=2608001 RepID=A0A5M6CFE0_9BACT|nr:class I SAM-dependent methyltransferase [Taibaiella lutea]KAA5533766.1 class I SAM-dependent methyltransferase [Taibaiella lutea]